MGLRSEGLTFKDIGARLGCRPAVARLLVIAAERRGNAHHVLAQHPDDLRALVDAGRLRRATFNAIYNLGARMEWPFERVSNLAGISNWHLTVTTGLGKSGQAEIKALMQTFNVELSPSPPPRRLRKRYDPS